MAVDPDQRWSACTGLHRLSVIINAAQMIAVFAVVVPSAPETRIFNQ